MTKLKAGDIIAYVGGSYPEVFTFGEVSEPRKGRLCATIYRRDSPRCPIVVGFDDEGRNQLGETIVTRRVCSC